MKFSYLIRKNGPSAVTTTTLGPNKGYTSSYTLYDGFLRPRQTQSPAAGGSTGRVLTDTTYDTRGLVERSNGPYLNAGAPGTTLVMVDDAEVPTQTVTNYDGAGRPVASIFVSKTVEKWRTTTSYGGDRVSITPPQGGTPTTTISDARGRTTELRQYHGSTPTGAFDATSYTYTTSDQLASMTDPAGNTWHYTYDLLGRQTSSEDPDKGTSTMTYDDAGQLLTTTDARGRTLAYSYDNLSRRTGMYEGSTTGTKLAEWTYDTLLKGFPTASKRFIGTNAYTTAVRGYTADGQPWGTSVTIPTSETGLAGTYSDKVTYQADGSPEVINLPTTPGLPDEVLTYKYDDLGNPTTLLDGLPAGTFDLVPRAQYTELGHPARFTLTTGSATAFLSYEYDASTQRLKNTKVEIGGITTPASDTNYDYDPAGNITSVANTVQGGPADTQCFTYDYLRRLTNAWTASTDCSTTPTTSTLGGPAPYWNTYGYDLTGNRTNETQHDPVGGTTGTTRDYTYPAPGQPHPHAPTGVTTTSGGIVATTAFGYDAAGNTVSRPQNDNLQTLDWDAEGNLASANEGGKTTSFVYSADGDRLIRRDDDGATLYLPSGAEIHVDPAGTRSSTRYYSFAGITVAMRTADGVYFLGADHNGTMTQQVTATDGTVVTRRFDPFGNPRGTPTGPWQGDRGYVGGTTDPTGLTHLGAREYDPVAGRFTSVDPILDTGDPQQMNGYAYANNSPITNSDPTGEICTNGPDGMCHKPDGTNVGTDGVSGAGGHASGDAPNKSKPITINISYPNDTTLSDDLNGHVTVNGDFDLPKHQPEGTGRLIAKLDEIRGHIPADQRHYYSTPELLAAACDSLGPRFCNFYFLWHVDWEAMRRAQPCDTTKCRVGEAGVTSGAGYGNAGFRRKGPTPGCNSFPPDTEVLMADGSHKRISALKPGDKVVATDPVTGRTEVRAVVATRTSSGEKHMVAINVQTGSATSTITTTDNHEIWVEDAYRRAGPNLPSGHWVTAAALRPGDRLRSETGVILTVAASGTYRLSLTVHNLTIDTTHTYYVLAGETPVLVHNSNCGVPSGSLQGEKLAQKLRLESANSPFTEGGQLTSDAIAGSRLAIPGTKIGNKELQARFAKRGGASQWGKYSTETHQSPYGDYQVHFYMNRASGEVMYDYDYKVVMNRRGSAP